MYTVKPKGDERVQEKHWKDDRTSFGKIDRHQEGRSK
jgi:hypothetical protein